MRVPKTIISKMIVAAFIMIGFVIMCPSVTQADLPGHASSEDNYLFINFDRNYVSTILITGTYPNYTIKCIPNSVGAFDSWTNITGGEVGDVYSPETTFTVTDPYEGSAYAYAGVGRTVTFSVNNGSWNDETTNYKQIRIVSGKALRSDQIPAVGNKPNGGYREGSWDPPAPDTTTPITGAPDYYYSYAPITVTFNQNGGNVQGSTDNFTRTVGSNGKLSELPRTYRDNYRFDGWFDENTTMATAVTLAREYTADTTLVAHWTETSAPTNHSVTYKVVHGKWDDDSTGDKSETVADGGTLAAIPAVGNKPYDHYRTGSWTPSTPTAATTITEDKVYTYTYSEVGKIEYNVTFKVKKGSWDEGGKADKTVKLSKYEDEDRALVLAAGDIPAVGHNPDEGYTAGEWDVVPNTETHITSDKTYTYTYSGSGPGPTVYSVTASNDGNGNAEADPESGESGTEVEIRATPKDGFKFKEWKVLSGGVDLESRSSATTTFRIKDANVEVKAFQCHLVWQII